MNGEIIRKAFEEAGITDPATKKQIFRHATWNMPIVADRFGSETDVTDRVVKAIKDYKEKHKGEDPHIVLKETELLKSIPPPLVVDINGKVVEGV